MYGTIASVNGGRMTADWRKKNLMRTSLALKVIDMLWYVRSMIAESVLRKGERMPHTVILL